MAVYHIKSTGSKTTGTSTADLWTDANCYADLDTALGQNSGDGNTFILDDEVHVMGTLPTKNDWLYTGTIQSRGGDPENCGYTTNSATADMIKVDVASGAGNWTFKNMHFTRNVTQTAQGVSLVTGIDSPLTGLTFTNCIFGDFDITTTVASGLGALFRNQSAARPWVFTNCKFRNINATHTNTYGCLGSIASAGCTFTFDDCTFENINRTKGGVTDATGMFYVQHDNHTVNITDCTFTDINQFGDDSSSEVYPIFRILEETVQLNMLNVAITRCNKSKAHFTAGIFIIFPCGHHIENITAVDCENRGMTDDTGGGDGGILYNTATAAGAVEGTIKGLHITRCKSRSGTALFTSNEAIMNVEGVTAIDCEADYGILYSGYDGDMNVNGVYIENAKPHNHAATAALAVGIYSRINPAAANDKTVNISNVTVVDTLNDYASGYDGIYVNNGHATATLTATLTNIISRNAGRAGYEVGIESTGGGPLVDSTDRINVLGGAASLTVTTAATNVTDEANSIDENGVPVAGSGMVGTGSKWWTGANPVGANGEPFSDWDTDIGAIQSTWSPFHPSNL